MTRRRAFSNILVPSLSLLASGSLARETEALKTDDFPVLDLKTSGLHVKSSFCSCYEVFTKKYLRIQGKIGTKF